MNEKTNRAVHLVVNRALLQSVHWPVKGVVNRDVDGAVSRTVSWAVSWAVYRAANANGAVNWTVHGIRQPDPKHPALQEFLHSCGAEMET